MKSFYPLTMLFLFLFLFSCSKDFLKSYDTRIIGTWHITDVDRYGWGGGSNHLPFTSGTFTFYEDGKLNYTDAANNHFNGSWDIVKKQINDESVRSLQLTAVDFTNQQVKTEYYDDIQFTGTNRFKATTISGNRTYITNFRR
ncbi:MAG: hypothetical protein ACR2KB_09595 [Chitinophagaceae bacterium]